MELVSRSEISAGAMPAGAPHAFLSVSSVSGFQGSRGPSGSRRPLPSVRGARRYITRTTSPGQGGIAPFSWEGAPPVAVFPMRPGITRFDCPSGRAHNSYISPGKDVGRRCEHPDTQGRESTKCSRARLTKRARPLGAPNNYRAESIEAKSAEEVDASLYIVAFCRQRHFPLYSGILTIERGRALLEHPAS